MSFVMITSEFNGNAVDYFEFWGGQKLLITYRCNSGNNQRFRLVEQSDGHFVIALKGEGGNKCIDVNMGEDPPLVISDVNGGISQLWRLEMVEAGLFRIISAHNGLALTMPPGTPHGRAASLSLRPVEFSEEEEEEEEHLKQRQRWRIFPVRSAMFPYFTDREMAKYTFPYSEDVPELSSASGSNLANRIKSGKYQKERLEEFVISVDVDRRVVIFSEREVERIVQMTEVSDASFTISWPNTAWGIAPFVLSVENSDVLLEKVSIEWKRIGDLDAPRLRDQSLQAARDCLEKHGFVVISDVYDAADLDRAKDLCGADLLASVDIDACSGNEPMNAWYNELKSKPLREVPEAWRFGSSYHCNGNKFGLAQAQFAWHTRLNQRVKKIYFDLYNNRGGSTVGPNRVDTAEDLCVGTDRVFFTPQISTKDHTSFWPHVDINESHNDVATWSVYQGLLYIWDSKGRENENAATVILPDSHKTVYRTVAKYGGSQGHFLTIDSLCKNSTNTSSVKEGNLLALRFLSEARRVSIRPGSLLIWNSRTMHQGWSEGRRLAVPICFEPKIRRQDSARRRKLVMVSLGLPSTHWASLGIQHGDTVGDLDSLKRGSVISGEVMALPTKMGGIESYAWKLGVTKDQIRSAVGALESALENAEYTDGAAETAALEALIKDEVLNLL